MPTRLSRYTVVVVTMLFLPGARSTQEQVPSHSAVPEILTRLRDGKPVTVVCIGDSITGVYYHTGGRRAYPEMVEVALKRDLPQAKVKVINAGISGDTLPGGLKRFERDVLRHKPDL